MADNSNSEPAAPNLAELAEAIVAEIVSPKVLDKLRKHEQETHLERTKDTNEMAWKAISVGIEKLTSLIIEATSLPGPIGRGLGKAAINTLLGEGAEFASEGNEVGRRIIAKLAGPGGALEPSVDAAASYMGLILSEQIEAWARGVFGELISGLAPAIVGVAGGVEAFQRLQDIVETSLGGQRMVRRVLQPFLQATAITPAQWFVNKQYRPELLSVGDAVRQFLRGRWTREQLEEELARQGWSADRIEAHVNAQRKVFSVADVRQFETRGHWTREQAIQHLRDQGYTETEALDALRIEGLNRFEQVEGQEAAALITAYAARDIDRGEFTALLGTHASVATDRALWAELGELRRALNRRFLSAGEARRLAEKHVLSVVDYRRALEREGYEPEAVMALELELRFDLDARKALEDHRTELAAERAAEQQQREEERAARKAEIEAERALRRRGPLGDLERAAVRGLIPFARVEEVLAAQYDQDTVAILVGLIEQDRQTYLAQRAAAEEARKRAARRDVDVGTLEQAVLLNQLDLGRFRQRLEQLHFSPEDVDLLAKVLTQRKKDLDDAKRTRDEAALAAKRRSVDLGRFERLVRKGARTMAAYTALLTSLGFDDGARAAMVDLLTLEIAEDREADAARQAGEARMNARGLSLEQFRRAVVLGLKTVAQYNTFLVEQGFEADAMTTLVAEAEAAAEEAETARRRRAEAEAARLEPVLSLSTVARAARLGVVSPAVYQDRLRRDGYSEDDIAIELELLVTEIADVQAARRRRDALEASQATRELSLAQVERAVKVGAATLEDYRARAATLGYAPVDVALLVDVLEAERATLTAARARRGAVEGELATRALSLGTLEQTVKQGLLSLDAYSARLRELGFSADDAALQAALLESELGG